MVPSDPASPRKRQVLGWRHAERRASEIKRRIRKGVGLRTRALEKGK